MQAASLTIQCISPVFQPIEYSVEIDHTISLQRISGVHEPFVHVSVGISVLMVDIITRKQPPIQSVKTDEQAAKEPYQCGSLGSWLCSEHRPHHLTVDPLHHDERTADVGQGGVEGEYPRNRITGLG